MMLDAPLSLNTVIEIKQKCPGLAFENVRIEKFTDSGLSLMNAVGKDGEMIIFRGLELDADPEGQGGGRHRIRPARGSTVKNDYLEFEGLKFQNIPEDRQFRVDTKDAIGSHVIGIPLKFVPRPSKK